MVERVVEYSSFQNAFRDRFISAVDARIAPLRELGDHRNT
jgi:hypothetical protein